MSLFLREVSRANMSKSRPMVAHCLAGHRPQPFISDQARGLRAFDPVVFARDRIDVSTWGHTRIYAAQDSPGWTDSSFTEPLPGFDDVPAIFTAALKRHDIRLMHAHHAMFALEFLTLSQLAPLPLIVSCYGFDVSGFPASCPANAKRLRMLFDHANLVLAMSEDMREDLIGLGCDEKRVAIHRPAIDISRFRYRGTQESAATGEIRIFSVSDFTAKKGTVDLVRAFAMVHSALPQVRLHLVGAPITTARSSYDETREEIQRLGIGDYVSMPGWNPYDRQCELYGKYDLFVLASKTAMDGSKEGVPAVVLEAMATGVPVVSTWHAGIPEAVADGVTGLLVNEGDVAALADAIAALAVNPRRRAAMGAAGRMRIVERFALQAQCARLEDLYQSVLDHA